MPARTKARAAAGMAHPGTDVTDVRAVRRKELRCVLG
jgi:hypothetical protein